MVNFKQILLLVLDFLKYVVHVSGDVSFSGTLPDIVSFSAMLKALNHFSIFANKFCVVTFS